MPGELLPYLELPLYVKTVQTKPPVKAIPTQATQHVTLQNHYKMIIKIMKKNPQKKVIVLIRFSSFLLIFVSVLKHTYTPKTHDILSTINRTCITLCFDSCKVGKKCMLEKCKSANFRMLRVVLRRSVRLNSTLPPTFVSPDVAEVIPEVASTEVATSIFSAVDKGALDTLPGLMVDLYTTGTFLLFFLRLSNTLLCFKTSL